jgi:hypothetical protein
MRAATVEVALVGLHLAHQCGEQAGLAGAVAADHAHPPAGVQGEVDVGQQQAFAATQGEIAEGNHRTIVSGGGHPGARGVSSCGVTGRDAKMPGTLSNEPACPTTPR